MENNYVRFEKEIHTYCDNHQKEKVLFPAFTNLWEEDYPKSRRDLIVITSRILSKLMSKDILREVPKHERFHTPYGLYEIS